MALHIVDAGKSEIVTVQNGRRDRRQYDLPKGAVEEGLADLVKRNCNAIDGFIATEDYVKATEWKHFLDYLERAGIPASQIDYLNSEEPNYIAQNIGLKSIVAGTVPQYSTLTYIVPQGYGSQLRDFAAKNNISLEEAMTIVYLHEALHNVIHHWKDARPSQQKEKEIEASLTEYFLKRADESSGEERQHYRNMAQVTGNRLGRLKSAYASFREGKISEEEVAALEEELLSESMPEQEEAEEDEPENEPQEAGEEYSGKDTE